jgi:hypothetical protein
LFGSEKRSRTEQEKGWRFFNMRKVTFQGNAVILGRERIVALQAPPGVQIEASNGLALMVVGLTTEEAEAVIAAMESMPTLASKDAPAKLKLVESAPAVAPEPTKPAPAVAPAVAPKPAVAPAAAAKPAVTSAKPAAAAKPAAKAAPPPASLDPAGPEDEDEGDQPATVDDDPWGLSQTEIPKELTKPDARLRDVVTFVRSHILVNTDEEPTLDQLSSGVDALRGKIPLVGRIASTEMGARVKGVVQVLGFATPLS